MSALWAPLQAPLDDRPARGGAADQKARGLRAVPGLPERMARIPFITVLIAIFGVGMVGLLVVNTSLQNQAFESRALIREAAQLVYAEAELQSQLNQVRTPEQIATKASALGMRANPYPAFLVVPSGKVIGERHRITGDEMKGLIVRPPPSGGGEGGPGGQGAGEGGRGGGEEAGQGRGRPAEGRGEGRGGSPSSGPRPAAGGGRRRGEEKAAEAAAKQKAAEAAAKQRAADAAAKKKSQQGGGN